MRLQMKEQITEQLHSNIVALKFEADWCQPCKLLNKHFEKIKEEFKDVEYLSVDVDESPLLAREYEIKNVPSVILLNKGQEYKRIIGLVKISALRNTFREFLKEVNNGN
jgi:thioredoxin